MLIKMQFPGRISVYWYARQSASREHLTMTFLRILPRNFVCDYSVTLVILTIIIPSKINLKPFKLFVLGSNLMVRKMVVLIKGD